MPDKRVVKNIDGVTHFVTKKGKRSTVKSWVKRYHLKPILIVVLIVTLSGGAVIYVQNLRKGPNLDTVTVMTNVLSKHLILPKNEQPIIATVTDKSALKTPFLREADDGDKIIIYEKARRVIIYRPSADRIVDIGPVELDNIPKTK